MREVRVDRADQVATNQATIQEILRNTVVERHETASISHISELCDTSTSLDRHIEVYRPRERLHPPLTAYHTTTIQRHSVTQLKSLGKFPRQHIGTVPRLTSLSFHFSGSTIAAMHLQNFWIYYKITACIYGLVRYRRFIYTRMKAI